MSGVVSHVSDTALWVAFYRAMESERPDALFRDPYARKLAGAKGEEIVRTLPNAKRFAWPMIVRTAVIDEIVSREARQGGVDAVVNLAAGLDARAWRLDLPATLRWMDVDLPGIIRYKREHLAGERPRCLHEYVEADLTQDAARRGALERAREAGRNALVISEGLLIYLEREQVAALARDLRSGASFRGWVFDLANPRILKMMERNWGKHLAAGRAPFRFAPAEGTAFFAPYGWSEAEFRSMWEESLRLGRSMPLARFWNLVGRLYPRRLREEFRRMSGIVLLRPSPSR